MEAADHEDADIEMDQTPAFHNRVDKKAKMLSQIDTITKYLLT
jgi:hypothetical protein